MATNKSKLGHSATHVLALTLLGEEHIGKWVFKERKKTANRKDKDNWCVGTLLLLQELKLDNFWKYGFLGTREKWRDLVRGRVRKREEDAWRRRVASRPRLGTYRKIKRSLELEEYLDVLEGQRKRNIIEIRSGVNQLEMEQGRRRKVKREDRVCKICACEVEDEEHFLLRCKLYDDIRERWKEDIGVQSHLDNEKTLERMIGTGKWKFRWRCAGKNVSEMLERRRSALTTDRTR